MSFPEASFVEANGIEVATYQSGTGPAVVLLHGFPELAWSWRHQMEHLAERGWHVIAIDQRGYGLTGPQGDLAAYRMANLASDGIGVLDALQIGRAAVVGHDFGGVVAWTLARDHPDRILGVASLNTPYTRRTGQDLVATMREYRGPENYMVQFQQPGVGEALLERDIAATFRGLMRRPRLTLAEFRQAGPRLQALPMSLFIGEPEVAGDPVMSEAELDVYVDAFTRTGFTGPLNWYRNLRRNWEDGAGKPDLVTVPALMVTASDDFFLPPDTTAGMERHVPDLERHQIADCGHWTQCERPEEVNRVLSDWLERRIRPLLAGGVKRD